MPSKTNVTGALTDAAGNVVTSGNVLFTITSGNADQQYYRITGTSVLVPNNVNAVINASGLIKAEDGTSVLQMWGNDVISPANSWYRLKFTPNGGVASVIDGLLVSGASYDLTTPTFYDPGTGGGAVQSGHIFFVTGAPINATGTDGDIAFRTDGGALTTMYQRRSGIWVGLV